MDIKLINIGFGNIVAANRIISIISPESAPIKRIIQEARDNGTLIDATYGRRTRAVIVTDSGHIILSAADNKSLNITLNGSGKGWFITNGKAEKITWKKDKQMSGQTKYFDETGKEIVLNTGKTWVQIVQNEYADNVVIK